VAARLGRHPFRGGMLLAPVAGLAQADKTWTIGFGQHAMSSGCMLASSPPWRRSSTTSPAA